MLKTCSVCGRIHDDSKQCYRPRTKVKTKQNTFRNTNKWHEMSRRIRERDNYLCQICISGKYNTVLRYNFKELEVHHIVPLEKDYSKRLDRSNLITLCRYHHKMAEAGEISKEELLDIVKEKEAPEGSRKET